jgi:hypothetical protein
MDISHTLLQGKDLIEFFGVVAVVVFYALAVCEDVFGLFILAMSLPLGVGVHSLLVIEACRKLKTQFSFKRADVFPLLRHINQKHNSEVCNR